MTPVLDILICTVVGRTKEFLRLESEFLSQISEHNLEGYVTIRVKKDNKEMSVGRKRQLLLEESTAKYIVFFDDDDDPYKNYVIDIYNAIKDGNTDCVGLVINMTTNGRTPQICCHSLMFPEWKSKHGGYDYVRNVTHFNPVKRELALKCGGFKDMRFGEDKDYADRLTPLCKKEVFLKIPVFHYRFSNQMSHNQKYGIK